MNFLTALAITLFTMMAAAAPEEYCQARKQTVSKIEQLRIVELPYKAVKLEVVRALINDKCVKSRLSDEEIYMLSEMLLSYEYNQDAADQIIGEFLAQ